MNKHTISLRGPWTARAVVAGDNRSIRLNIKSSADWNAWQNEFPDASELILERKFNWLFPEPAPQRVEVQVKCRVAPIGKLNGKAIPLDENDSVFSAEVTQWLQSANRLELHFRLNHDSGGTPDLEWVELHSHG